MNVPDHERGAALLAVLVLVAIMGAIAAAAFEKLRLSTALAVNNVALDQARHFAMGIEALIALRIDDMKAAGGDVTPEPAAWNGVRRPLPMPGGGMAHATIRDGGNCFNLNGLVEAAETEEGPGPRSTRPAAVAQFVALMEAIGFPHDEARRIADGAADWADSDGTANPFGAEDAVYAGAERPYRAANALFAEPSELRAIAGVTPEAYRRLRPFLCALPVAEPARLNANSLRPEEAPLLAMLAPGMVRAETARALIAARPAGGWRDLQGFWTAAARAGLPQSGDGIGQVGLETDWFALELEIGHGGAELIETALVDGRRRPARIAARRWGPEE